MVGVGFSALYSTITSLGTTQISMASPRLVSLLLGAGGCGTIAAPLITSYIKSIFGLEYVFFVCSGFMFTIALLALLTLFINYKKRRQLCEL
jgi:fucose permease